MIGMVYKDVLVMRKQAGYYLCFMLVYAVLAIAGVFPPSVLGALVVMCGMMMPMTSFSFDDQARWDKYAAATPAGRAGIVGGKYLFTLLAILAASAAALAAHLVLAALGKAGEDMVEILLIVLACAAVALVMNAVILPLLFKFGAEKSRVISMILFVSIFGGVMGLSIMAEKGIPIPTPPAWLVSVLPVVLALAAIGGFVISYFISRGIFEKKEL